MAVAVARGDTVLWEEAFGMADPVRHAAATPSTMYQTASVTKLVTASALAVLWQRGQLDVQRPVNAYLGSEHLTSLAWDPAGATVWRVATQTSGLATYDDFCAVPEPLCQEAMIRRYGVLIWRPGERFDYSNLGYGVLSEVVRHVSGESFGDFVRDSIFRPLGLAHCTASVSGAALAPGLAVPYDTHAGRVEHPRVRAAQGASAVWCSAHDLLRFAMVQLGERVSGASQVLADSAIRALRVWTVPAGDGLRYGFGWWHERRSGYDLTYVGGGTSEAVALLYTVPAQRIAVVVMANTYTPLASAVVDDVLSTLLPGYGAPHDAASTAPTAPRKESPDSRSVIVGSWRGAVYTGAGSRTLTLFRGRGDTIWVALAGAPAIPLMEASERDGELAGAFAGNLGIDRSDRRRHYMLRLVLVRRSPDRLNGGVWTRPLPGADDDPLHTYWAEVRRERRPGASPHPVSESARRWRPESRRPAPTG